MAKLTVTEGPSRGKTFDLKEDVSFLGRSSKCEIQILDPSVSRIHLKIFKIVNTFFIEDLKSSNGTSVNGNSLKPGEGYQVEPEDVILLGKDTRISIEGIRAGKDSGIQNTIGGVNALPRRSERYLDGERRSRTLGQSNLISSVSRFLTDTLELGEFMGKMLKALLESLPRVDRAAVFLCETERHDAESFASETKSDQAYRAVDYEKKLVRRVLKEGKEIFLADTLTKELRSLSMSEESAKIKSVACIPIVVQHETYGVLYIDGIRGPYAFREEDLSMLQTLTNLSAAALIHYQWTSTIFSMGVPGHAFGQKRNDTVMNADLSYRGKPAFVSFLPTYLFCFLVSSLIVYFSPHISGWINDQVFSLLRTTPPRIFLRVNYGMVLAVPFVLFGVHKALWNSMTSYEVDAKGVHLLTGSLIRKEYHLAFHEFEDVSFRQNLMEAPLKVGTLILKSGAWGECGLRGVHNVKNLTGLIRLRKNEPPKRLRHRY